MNERATSEEIPTTRRHFGGFRVLFYVLAVLVPLIVAGAFLLRWYFMNAGEKRLAAAMAELDRSDPGWRWEELLARREPILDNQNAALRVLAVVKLLPEGNQWYPRRTPRPAAQAPDDNRPPVESQGDEGQPPGLEEEIQELVPTQRLEGELARELRSEMERVQAALKEARPLAEMPRGRFPIEYKSDLLSTPAEAPQQARKVVQLLILDAVLAAEERDLTRALLDCQAAFNAGRSVGEEPNLICFLIRVACVSRAVQTLERVLAQGETSDRTLAAWQKLLEDEAKQPLFPLALRGERAGSFNTMEMMFKGQLNVEDLANAGAPKSSKPNSALQWTFLRPLIRTNQAALLEMMTKALEISKQAPSEQGEAWKAWEQDLRAKRGSSPHLAMALLLAPAVTKVSEANSRYLALLQSARLALAAERYRLAKGGWPEKLEQLPPDFIAKIPPDPFAKGPLRMKRREGHAVFYSVGPNGIDDGGSVEKKDQQQKSLDIGFRLWDLDKRRQPFRPADPNKSDK